MNKQES